MQYKIHIPTALCLLALLASATWVHIARADSPLANPPLANPPLANPPLANPPLANPTLANLDLGSPTASQPALKRLQAVDVEQLQFYNLSSIKRSSGYFQPPPHGDTDVFIKQLQQRSLSPVGSLKTDFAKSSRYWLASQLVNSSGEEIWYLHISRFFLDTVTVSVFDGQTLQRFHSDFAQGIQGVFVNPVGRSFPLQLKAGVKYTLVVDIALSGKVISPYIGLIPQNQYRAWSYKLIYLYLLPVGALLAFFSICIFSCIILKDTTFFWLGISTLTLLIFNLWLGVFRFELLPGLTIRSNTTFVLGSVAIISTILFSYNFLSIRKHNRILYKLHMAAFWGSVAIALLGFVLPNTPKIIAYSFNALLIFITLLGGAVYKVIKGERFYYIYLFGWTPLMVSFLILPFLVLTKTYDGDEITISYRDMIELYAHNFHVITHLIALYYRLRSLKKQKLKAEQESRAKSWFIAANSHDLKQPLNSITMHLELLQDEVTSQQGRQIMKNLEVTCREMSTTFYAIMDLSKLEAGKQQVNNELFPLSRVLDSVYRHNSVQAHNKRLTIKLVSSKQLLNSDPILLERIVNNLVANAIRYTVKGKVLIGCRRRNQGLGIQVLDTGVGIDEQNLPLIFDPYARADASPNTGLNMGLGLSIVTQLCELLGYSIRAQSTLGRGSVFEVFIPARKLEKTPLPSALSIAKPQGDSALTIILATEEAGELEAFTHILDQWGHPYRFASDIANINDQGSLVITSNSFYTLHRRQLANMAESTGSDSRVFAVVVPVDAAPELFAALRDSKLQALFTPPQPSQLRAVINFLRGQQAI